MLQITTENFENEVLKSEIPVVIDFWATWCGPCRMFGPIFEKVGAEMEGVVKFGKLNVDEEGSLAQMFRVMSIPTMILFKDGKPVKKSVGLIGKDKLREFLAE